ncbi:MAG TPA: hypothetical protein VEZ14_04660 [Dehalococcoidia bacterium]|nr:hypothetical protein [Dehalococcoidia bacterium]
MIGAQLIWMLTFSGDDRSVLDAHATPEVVYKVWVQVERIERWPDGDERYTDIGLPDPLGKFRSLSAAQAWVRSLPGWYADGSDNR